MDRAIAEATIRTLLPESRQRLETAAAVTRPAEACAETGNSDKAVQILPDIEQLAYEASRLFDAASLINRISRVA